MRPGLVGNGGGTLYVLCMLCEAVSGLGDGDGDFERENQALIIAAIKTNDAR